MKFISKLKEYPIFRDTNYYIFLLIIIFSLFTIVAQVYYIYVHGFNVRRCSFMNNNDKTRCVTKSDMRNFLYNKVFN